MLKEGTNTVTVTVDNSDGAASSRAYTVKITRPEASCSEPAGFDFVDVTGDFTTDAFESAAGHVLIGESVTGTISAATNDDGDQFLDRRDSFTIDLERGTRYRVEIYATGELNYFELDVLRSAEDDHTDTDVYYFNQNTLDYTYVAPENEPANVMEFTANTTGRHFIDVSRPSGGTDPSDPASDSGGYRLEVNETAVVPVFKFTSDLSLGADIGDQAVINPTDGITYRFGRH